MSKLLVETYRQEQGVTINLRTGYMTSGMEMAAALHRLIYGTREAALLMSKALCRNFARAGDYSSKDLKFILQLNLVSDGKCNKERRTEP